jgi:outer membrane protein OmpA-like peptidoglycan-associated protein
MMKNFKYFGFALGVCLFGVNGKVKAQDTTAQQGEIVMTKAELDSFLDMIKEKKRARMKKRADEIRIDNSLNAAVKNSHTGLSTATMNTGDLNSALLLREIERINTRLDWLMASGQSSTTYAYPPAQPFYSNPQPTTVITQPRTKQLITEVVPSRTKFEKQTTSSDPEKERLIAANAQLQEELRVLNALSNNGGDSAYQEEMASLKAKIAQLDAAIAEKNSGTTTVYKIKEADPIKRGLEQYQKAIFFANNSTQISAADEAKLNEVVEIVENNSPHITVVLRGYASAKGNAMYNNTLSFNRAEAIKKALLRKGLSSKDIVTMHHGVDHSGNEADARRVEISFIEL